MGGDVGSQYTPAAGFAQGIRYRVESLGERSTDGSITVVFGGDGSVASNGFWSALTMATTLSLPLLFVIEDNGYAISVTSPYQTPGANIAENLASFANLKIWSGSGTRPEETASIVHDAVEYVRAGNGPGMLRLTVPRLSGHTLADNQAYKTEDIHAREQADDPLTHLENYLVPQVVTQGGWLNLIAEVDEAVTAAMEASLNQGQPEPGKVLHHAYSSPDSVQQVGGIRAGGIALPQGTETPTPPNPMRINMIEAIRRTLDTELALNPFLLVFGEDVGEKGGVHAATLGLQTTHGVGRVFDTSLSEEGIIGRSVGLAYAGLMPVPEIQFRKYADPATEQLNNIGTTRWRTAGKFAVPVVVRIPGGYRKIGDPWHSVTSEVVFAHQPGWKLAFPSNAEDTVGLLRTALRGDDPVIFFEHRAMLDAGWARRPYPGDEYIIPFGKASFLSRGDDLTIVTWGAMVERCEEALRRNPVSVDLIDLRTIVPWDRKAVLDSVKRTSRCLVVHEDIALGGFGAEIASTIGEEIFLYLDAPVTRLAAPPVPVPFNTGLMDNVVPTVERIATAISDLLAF